MIAQAPIQIKDPELERILQDIKRLRNGIAALEDRVLVYLATKSE